MQLRDIKRDHENGLLGQCSVESVMGAYCIRFRYKAGSDRWEVLERQRDGTRLFSSVDAALRVAKEVGFSEVKVLM